jgi:hypothetical protein
VVGALRRTKEINGREIRTREIDTAGAQRFLRLRGGRIAGP